MLKKWFDWTPSDIAAWEAIRQRGLGRFLLWYSALFGGGMFVLLVVGALIFGAVRAAGAGTTSLRPAYLALILLFLAVVSLAGGLVNSIITWVMEEKLYQKYKALAMAAQPAPAQGDQDDRDAGSPPMP